MIFTNTPAAIALCLQLGMPNCWDGTGGFTWFQLQQEAIRRGVYDSGGGCPVTLKGSGPVDCLPPDEKVCIVIGRYSMPPTYPNGVVFLCRTPAVS